MRVWFIYICVPLLSHCYPTLWCDTKLQSPLVSLLRPRSPVYLSIHQCQTRWSVWCALKQKPEGNNVFEGCVSHYNTWLSCQTHTHTHTHRYTKQWFLISSRLTIQKPKGTCVLIWMAFWIFSSSSVYPGMPADIPLMSNAVWANARTRKHTNTHGMRRWTDTSNKAFVCCLTAIPLSPPLLLFLLLSLSPSPLPVIPKHSFYPLVPSLSGPHARTHTYTHTHTHTHTHTPQNAFKGLFLIELTG